MLKTNRTVHKCCSNLLVNVFLTGSGLTNLKLLCVYNRIKEGREGGRERERETKQERSGF